MMCGMAFGVWIRIAEMIQRRIKIPKSKPSFDEPFGISCCEPQVRSFIYLCSWLLDSTGGTVEEPGAISQLFFL